MNKVIMFTVKKSLIEGAGEGLFALTDIPAGYQLEYIGTIKRTEQLESVEIDVAVDIGYGLSLVGSGLGAKVNDGRGNLPANMKWVVSGDGDGIFSTVYMESIVDIPAGTELYIDYGVSYWEHHAKRHEVMLQTSS